MNFPSEKDISLCLCLGRVIISDIKFIFIEIFVYDQPGNLKDENTLNQAEMWVDVSLSQMSGKYSATLNIWRTSCVKFFCINWKSIKEYWVCVKSNIARGYTVSINNFVWACVLNDGCIYSNRWVLLLISCAFWSARYQIRHISQPLNTDPIWNLVTVAFFNIKVNTAVEMSLAKLNAISKEDFCKLLEDWKG